MGGERSRGAASGPRQKARGPSVHPVIELFGGKGGRGRSGPVKKKKGECRGPVAFCRGCRGSAPVKGSTTDLLPPHRIERCVAFERKVQAYRQWGFEVKVWSNSYH